MIKIRLVDIETTGKEPPVSGTAGGVCELGWTDLTQVDTEEWEVGNPRSMLVNPGCAIPPDMSGIHGITDDDVQGKPWIGEALDAAGFFDAKITLLAAHVARFERLFLDPVFKRVHGENKTPEPHWICTWKNAITLAPRAKYGHKLQTLRYWLKLDVSKELADPAHRAGPDTYVAAHLLKRELNVMTVARMLELQRSPAILPFFTIGEHAMQPTDTIPSSYFRWMLTRDFDEDVIATAKAKLAWRAAHFNAEGSGAPPLTDNKGGLA